VTLWSIALHWSIALQMNQETAAPGENRAYGG